MSPIIKNKGSAIFYSYGKKKLKKTEGCIALKKMHLRKIKFINKLKNNKNFRFLNQK